MTDITPRERIQLQMHQEQIGRQFKAEIVLRSLTVTAVAEALVEAGEISHRTQLSQYLGGLRLWPAGLDDFQRAVRAGIEAASEEKVA